MKRSERVELGKKRLLSILHAQTIACDRTLEQKISDAGPNPMRVEPNVLTQARNSLTKAGTILWEKHGKAPWYYLKGTPRESIDSRLAVLVPLHAKTQAGMFTHRIGQTLEIAVLKALQKARLNFLGHFTDLDLHDDSTAYTKVDPPMTISGKKLEKGPLDYIVFPNGICAGIEVKNYRTWLYPRSSEVRDLLWKCGDIDAVPVLIARRLPFLTIRLLQMGGCLIHENYNQLYPTADAELAALVRDKNLLGYHDVRTGSDPDGRMMRFIEKLLPGLVNDVRPTFTKFRDAHRAYGKGEITYAEWLKELKRGSKRWKAGLGEEARAEGKA